MAHESTPGRDGGGLGGVEYPGSAYGEGYYIGILSQEALATLDRWPRLFEPMLVNFQAVFLGKCGEFAEFVAHNNRLEFLGVLGADAEPIHDRVDEAVTRHDAWLIEGISRLTLWKTIAQLPQEEHKLCQCVKNMPFPSAADYGHVVLVVGTPEQLACVRRAVMRLVEEKQLREAEQQGAEEDVPWEEDSGGAEEGS
jgi:hypothetical protein